MMPSRDRLERLFGRVLTPFESFLRRTTAGGIVLMATTAMTLGLASIVGGEALHHFWDAPVRFTGLGLDLSMTRHHLVNDGLMALFFLLVGLELKREMLVGELSSPRDAALPIIAALGGMLVPAALFAFFNARGPGSAGWGIPMATDIAFAVGILVLLAARVPRNLVVFLTALAIADDLGAVLVIALFYTAQLDGTALALSGAITLLLALLNGGGIRHPLAYAAPGLLLWYFLLASGLHATLAGIVLAAAVPARAASTPREFAARMDELGGRWKADLADLSTPEDPLRNGTLAALAQSAERASHAVQSPLQRMEHSLTPWVTFVVIPIFAAANAGIDLAQVPWASALREPVTMGVMAGLVFGKFTGIALACWLAVRAGWARLPAGVEWRHLLGAAWLGGIGFTMSLFIAELAFPGQPALVEQARLGILFASAVAAAIGLAWLYRAGSTR